MKIEVIRQDGDMHEIKIPFVHKDEFGNQATFFRKETVHLTQLDVQIVAFQKQIDELKAKKDAIINHK